eukprot:1039080-Alexandrium_andersonii.AAC.1
MPLAGFPAVRVCLERASLRSQSSPARFVRFGAGGFCRWVSGARRSASVAQAWAAGFRCRPRRPNQGS